MAKKKQLSKRQLDVIEDLFVGELTEQCILDKYKVGRRLFGKWLTDELFAEHLDRRIAASYRQSAAYIARYAPLAASKLVDLTESDKPETARKACLDIISMQSDGQNSAGTPAASKDGPASAEDGPSQLSAEAAGKILAILAQENATE